MAVVSVGREKIIAALQAGQPGDSGGLLADVDVIMAAEVSGVMKTDERLFEATNEQHSATKVEQRLAR
jgi:hypothetical protein